MKLDDTLLSQIAYKDSLNKKQLEILKLSQEQKLNWKSLALNSEVSKNDINLLLLLKGIEEEKYQEQLIKNYHTILARNNIKARVYTPNNLETNSQNSSLTIYCDGACTGNPGKAGSGLAIYQKDKNPILLYGNYIKEATNNIAELNALYKALLIASQNIDDNIISIFTDSKYSLDCIKTWAYSWKKNGWKKKTGEIKNLALIIKTHELFEKIKDKIELNYVKAHSNIQGNELADRMAVLAIKEEKEAFETFTYSNIEDILKIK